VVQQKGGAVQRGQNTHLSDSDQLRTATLENYSFVERKSRLNRADGNKVASLCNSISTPIIQANFLETHPLPAKPLKEEIAEQYKTGDGKQEFEQKWEENRFLKKINDFQKVNVKPYYSLARLATIKSDQDNRVNNTGPVKVHADVGNLEAALRGRQDGKNSISKRMEQERKEDVKSTKKRLIQKVADLEKTDTQQNQDNQFINEEQSKTAIEIEIKKLSTKLIGLGIKSEELTKILKKYKEKLGIDIPTQPPSDTKEQTKNNKQLSQQKEEKKKEAPYQGGHLIAYQFLEEQANIYENVVPQGQQLNNVAFQNFESFLAGTIKNRNPLNEDITPFIEYRVQVEYPKDQYNVTPEQLVNLGIIPEEHLNKEGDIITPEEFHLSKFIPQRLYADAFLLDETPPLPTLHYGKIPTNPNEPLTNQHFVGMIPKSLQTNMKLNQDGDTMQKQKQKQTLVALRGLRNQQKLNFCILNDIPEDANKITDEQLKNWTEWEYMQDASNFYDSENLNGLNKFKIKLKKLKNRCKMIKMIPIGTWLYKDKTNQYEWEVKYIIGHIVQEIRKEEDLSKIENGIKLENILNQLIQELGMIIPRLIDLKNPNKEKEKQHESEIDPHDPTAIDFSRIRELQTNESPLWGVGPFSFRAEETQPD